MLQLLPRWAYEHVPHEQSMVGTGADNTNIDSVALIPSGISIDNVYTISRVQIIYRTLPIYLPDLETRGWCQQKGEARELYPDQVRDAK